MVVPQRETASTWCAFGAASADVLHIHEAVDIMASPFDAGRLNRTLERLTRDAQAQMAKDGIALDRQHFEFALDMRHKGQINEVEIVLDWSRAEGAFEEPLKESFYRRYEQLYGRGASFRGARVEIVTYRVRASAETPRPKLVAAERLSKVLPADARRPARAVYWEELRRQEQTPIFDGLVLLPGNAVAGPCIVETPDTSVVVRPEQSLTVDAFGNFEVGLSSPPPAIDR
jgi:N-methylhydantoinase A